MSSERCACCPVLASSSFAASATQRASAHKSVARDGGVPCACGATQAKLGRRCSPRSAAVSDTCSSAGPTTKCPAAAGANMARGELSMPRQAQRLACSASLSCAQKREPTSSAPSGADDTVEGGALASSPERRGGAGSGAPLGSRRAAVVSASPSGGIAATSSGALSTNEPLTKGSAVRAAARCGAIGAEPPAPLSAASSRSVAACSSTPAKLHSPAPPAASGVCTRSSSTAACGKKAAAVSPSASNAAVVTASTPHHASCAAVRSPCRS